MRVDPCGRSERLGPSKDEEATCSSCLRPNWLTRLTFFALQALAARWSTGGRMRWPADRWGKHACNPLSTVRMLPAFPAHRERLLCLLLAQVLLINEQLNDLNHGGGARIELSLPQGQGRKQELAGTPPALTSRICSFAWQATPDLRVTLHFGTGAAVKGAGPLRAPRRVGTLPPEHLAANPCILFKR